MQCTLHTVHMLVIVSACNVAEARSEGPEVTCEWIVSEYVHYAIVYDRGDVTPSSVSDVNPVVPI